jgi:hypothetical protein
MSLTQHPGPFFADVSLRRLKHPEDFWARELTIVV